MRGGRGRVHSAGRGMDGFFCFCFCLFFPIRVCTAVAWKLKVIEWRVQVPRLCKV
jgi:hypothetical protein